MNGAATWRGIAASEGQKRFHHEGHEVHEVFRFSENFVTFVCFVVRANILLKLTTHK